MAFEIVLPEYLEVNNVPLATTGWLFANVEQLWGDADVRGADRTVPLLEGDLPYPRRRAATSYSLEGLIFGEADGEGNPFASVREGIEQNLTYLQTYVSAPIDTGDGTVPAVLYRPTTQAEADIHCGPLKVGGRGRAALKATLRLSIPAGRFVVTASV